MKRRVRFLLAATGIVLLSSRHARADRIADAEQLFRQAKALVAAGKDVEACPLFAESHRLDPGVGTLLNLALCHEKTGRVASAWGEFRAVEQQARATNADRAELARKHAEALEPRISRLRVVVAGPPADVVLKLDGEEKPKALWQGITVDVGSHVIVVSAPGYVARETRVKVDDEGVTVDVPIPALAPAPVARATPERSRAPADVDREESRRARRTGGFILGGAGIAALGVGSVFGALALVTDGEAKDACPAPCVRTSPEAAEADRKTSRALDFATVSNVVLPIGAAALLVGAYLVLTSRAPSTAVSTSARGVSVRF